MIDRVVVEADGGSRGNPGPAGYGAVVKDAGTGEVLAEHHEYLGVVTNNVAEYNGLIAGLTAAAELGASTVDVRMDSKLVVEQMSGRWKIKHAALQPLAQRARELADRFDRVTYMWIPRAENSHADRLANVAMDGGTGKTGSARPEPQVGATGTGEADRVAKAGWTGARGTPTRVLLLRHGQTEMSIDRRYSGRGDVPLTERGQSQAAAAAKRLAAMPGLVGDDGEATPIVASPLTRTKQTAQAVADALGTRFVTHPGFVETDFGAWEGLTFTEAAQRDPELHRCWLRDSSCAPPGGESFEAVHERVGQALRDLIDQYTGRTVVVVSHVTPIKTVLRMGLDAGPSLLFRLHLDLASLSVVEFYPDGNSSVHLVNDICHLS
ncbi:bifunctional RNase H/acid phosphatase [Amycolatopsis sp. FDAARGOS 1241]|uniref:bifunctional RNase H/acid phosphatase n=1 Tax=Amycolatopsis sp. FDAARGOS 1241 TaxID=2778070 RepID=UPI0019525145|nr:bifunctional RNase H/acid phosphatase [Amycolatopsis sp. FDAARGOS 1241]QRP44988.1 bifunctional RNase H/acid phosphatase [Amycolatopsis sp. FDAARGOS 1241]